MTRLAQVVLISALVLAVLAFGGTEPLYFSVVQIILLAVGVLFLLSYAPSRVGKPKLPVVIPLILLALILFQIVPLPASGVQLIRGAAELPSETSYLAISIAPYQTLSHLLVLLTYLTAFYLTLVVCQSHSGKKRLIFALLALGAFEALYGLVQYLTGWQQIFSYVKIFNVHEATGTYINRSHFAGLLEMILPFALALAFYQFGKLWDVQPGRPARMRNLFGQADFQKLILWLFMAVILFLALFFSRSRMGIISSLVSTLVIIILMVTSAKHGRTGAVLAILFLSAGILMAIWIGPEPVIARFELLEQQVGAVEQGRWAIWRDTLELISQSPSLGSGFGTFPVVYTSAQTIYLSRFVNHAHNDYLEIVSELGIPAALLLFGAVFYLLWRVSRCFYAPTGDRFGRATALGCVGSLAAILLHSFTDFNLYIPANALLFSVILGLCYSNTRITVGRDHTAQELGC